MECLAKIIRESPKDIILDIGCPILRGDVRLNCRVVVYDRRIILIRPKVYLANDLNYREMRYFTPWPRKTTQKFILPKILRDIVGQIDCVIGDAVIDTLSTTFAAETCEELFTPASPHIEMSLNGVSVFTNSSASHHELRKLDTRIQLLLEATRKAKGIYIYANQQGADGNREYYDGSAMIMVNGQLIAQSSQFSLKDVEVITATLDLDQVTSSRCTPSRGLQAVQALDAPYERIFLEKTIHQEIDVIDPLNGPTPPLQAPRIHKPEEEIALGPACYLWDYLRRSGACGYFLVSK